jgi:hypothetical protein
MSAYNLNVSLGSSVVPYGLIAQAAFADIGISFQETADHEASLSHNGELVTDQAQITSILAGKAAVIEGSSKVCLMDTDCAFA